MQFRVRASFFVFILVSVIACKSTNYDASSLENAGANLTQEEIEALKGYSEGEYRVMNTYLRHGPKSKEFLDRMREREVKGARTTQTAVEKNIALMRSALKKLPPRKMRVWRLLDYDFNRVAEVTKKSFSTGVEYVDKGFMSVTSKKNGALMEDRSYSYSPSHVLTIDANNAIDISQFSTRPYEQELIIPAGTTFTVKSSRGRFVRIPDDVGNTIYQDEWVKNFDSFHNYFSETAAQAYTKMMNYGRPLIFVELSPKPY